MFLKCFFLSMEEGIVVLSNTNKQGAYLLAERIRKSIESLDIETLGGSGKVTVSGGVEQCSSSDEPATLLARSDELLYAAKDNGRNQILVAQG